MIKIKKLLKIFTLLLTFCLMLNVGAVYAANDLLYKAFYYNDTDTMYIMGQVPKGHSGTPASAIVLNADKSINYIKDTIIGEDGTFVFEFQCDFKREKSSLRLSAGGNSVVAGVLFPENASNIQAVQSDRYIIAKNESDCTVILANELINFSEDKLECSRIVALFDGNHKLINTFTLDSILVGTGSYVDELQVHIPYGYEKIYISTYYWDDTDHLTPVMNKATTTITTKEISDTFIYSENLEPIAENPGKGWVLYGTPTVNNGEILPLISVGYTRFTWSDIEPSEGNYNWTKIDNELNKWKNLNKKFAFGVMSLNSSASNQPYDTPKWVFDAGAKYTEDYTSGKYGTGEGLKYVPVWDDPVFMKKTENFVKALAQRYDGNPDIAYIDIRSIGNYGEGHMSGMNSGAPITVAQDIAHISLYAKHFKHTQLISPVDEVVSVQKTEEEAKYALSKNVGLRFDGAMSYNDHGSVLKLAHGSQPAVFECATSYTNMTTTHSFPDFRGWDAAIYAREAENLKPSYMDFGQWGTDADAFYEDNQELVRLLTNKMGYHFVLNSLEVAKSGNVADQVDFTMSWFNDGVTYLYEDCYVAVGLMDDSGNIISVQYLDAARPKTWKPGEISSFSDGIVMSDVADGDYTMVLGLFLDKNNAKPDYKIGNYHLNDNGWYSLCTVEKYNGKYEFVGLDEPLDLPYDMLERTNILLENGAEDVQSVILGANSNYQLSFMASGNGKFNYEVTDLLTAAVLSSGTKTISGNGVAYSVNFDAFENVIKEKGREIDIKFSGSGVAIDNIKLEALPDESGNLIENGDFERNWYYTVRTANSNGAKVSITNSNPASGKYCLKAYNIIGTNSGIRVRLPLLNKVGKYRIEFQYRKDFELKSSRIRVVPFVYDNVVDPDLTQYVNLSYYWNKFTYDLDLTEELSQKADFMTSLDIYADDEGTKWPASNFYIDNIKVYEITD